MQEREAPIPSVRHPGIEMALNQTSSLSSLAKWCQGLSWLPKEGYHFKEIEQTITLQGPKPLKIAGIGISDAAADYSRTRLRSFPNEPPRNSATGVAAANRLAQLENYATLCLSRGGCDDVTPDRQVPGRREIELKSPEWQIEAAWSAGGFV